MQIRPNTWDGFIIQKVMVENEYALPADLKEKTVLDIGAHIGAFAVACQKRGAKTVICYEPDPENFALLVHNVDDDIESRTGIACVNKAITGIARTDLAIRRLTNHDFDRGRNTGHVDVFGSESDGTESIAFDDAVKEIGCPIDILKLDCEGAEWEIFDTGDFSNIKFITAELHALPENADHPALKKYINIPLPILAIKAKTKLEEAGFNVIISDVCSETAKLVASKRAKQSIAEIVADGHKPRALWVGDAVITTGFGRVNEAICRRLVDLGWDLRALGIGYNGDPHNLPYKIYPAIDPNLGGARNGMSRIKSVVDAFNPDIIVINDDSWNVGLMIDNMAAQNITTPVIAYVAVDSENVREDHGIQMRNLKHAVCHTQFGVEQIQKAGYTGPSSVMPHGVEGTIYKPYSKEDSRTGIPLPMGQDPMEAFIFGAVAMNQPRKRLDLTIAYWTAWWNAAGRPENAYLYLHTMDKGAWDLRQLRQYFGIKGHLFTTSGGQILSDIEMPSLYNAFDVMISTSEGESFGIPVAEAQSCGIPNIAVRCGGLPSWAGDSVYWVEPSYYTFTANWTNTLRRMASETDYVKAMQDMYSNADLRAEYRERGLKKAAQLTWDAAGIHFDKVMKQVLNIRKIATDIAADALGEFN